MRDSISSIRRFWQPFITLLRLPFQFKLGPIFGWGFLLGAGTLDSRAKVLEAACIFVAFHIGAFGGLTALNSFYDRDDGPVGGLWQPPTPPKYLSAFAWSIQFTGLAIVLLIDARLALIYALIVTLALGYSHPKPRWKSHPWKSVAVVALGQGVLDFAAGVVTALRTEGAPLVPFAIGSGAAGATLVVCAFYPLTQLFQIKDDEERGDRTLAIELQNRFGLSGPFQWAQILFSVAAMLNLVAINAAKSTGIGTVALFLAASAGGLWKIELWRRDYLRRHNAPANAASQLDDRAIDFQIVHRLFGLNSMLFALLILAFLLHDSVR